MSQTQLSLLKKCKRDLMDNHIMAVIQELLAYISHKNGYPGVYEKLDALNEDYKRMLMFFQQGMIDPQRETIFKSYQKTLWNILQDIDMLEHCAQVSVFQAAALRIRGFESESFTDKLLSDYTFASDQAKDDYYNILFSSVLVSLHWSKRQEDMFVDLLLSDKIDGVIAQMLVSAIMLSCMTVYDFSKFSCLVRVYRSADNLRVKERALVGWVFALYQGHDIETSPQQALLSELCQDEAVRQELLELQKQIIFCLDAEKDASVLREKYMPEIMKNVPRHGMMPKDDFEESSLEEILHPHEEEEKVEQLEKTMRNIFDMEKAGSDVYFEGFSKMKSFGFFHTLSHWFMPFSLDVPALRPIFDKLEGSEAFLHRIQANAPFCDNDKYSFVLALNLTIGQMGQLKQILKSDVVFGSGNRDIEMDDKNPSWIRRMYLQDLYRFFMLSSMRKDFINPFDVEGSGSSAFFLGNSVFLGKEYEQIRLGICRFLTKRKDYKRLGHFIYSFNSSDIDYAMMVALYEFHHTHHYELASNKLTSILLKNPHNMPALKLLARCYFGMENYEDAKEIYLRIKEEGVDTLQINLHLAFCLIETSEYDKAVNLLYEQNYHHPNNIDILRPLAWGLIQKDELEKAEAIYDRIFTLLSEAKKNLEAEDCYNRALCLWCMHKVKDAVQLFVQYQKISKNEESLYAKLYQDFRLLNNHQINKLDILLMTDVVNIDQNSN